MLKKGGLWRDIYGIDEKRVASLVREDKVDILVELTGHTANNKLGTMACRPAPIQVVWRSMMHICFPIIFRNVLTGATFILCLISMLCLNLELYALTGYLDWLPQYNRFANN